MATEVKRKWENKSEPVSDQLLSHMSHHVFPATRKQFAIEHLKLQDCQYENIEWDERY